MSGTITMTVDEYGVMADKIEALRAERDALAAQLAELKKPLNRTVIRDVFLRNGFTIKDGQTDLKPYVYAAAEELLRMDGREATPAQQAVQELYECIGKGGEYEKLGYAKPSGAERAIRGESGLIVYRDARNGQLYYRDPHDFQRRMQKISAAPQSVAQESE